MRREYGSRKFPIWLIGDSAPEKWADVLDSPLDPRHPVRHNIWTPILDGIQEQVFLADRRRVNTTQLYVRNAVQDHQDKQANSALKWQPKLLKEVCDFGALLAGYTPRMVFTFGQFAFEFARRSLKENPERKYTHWTTKALGQEFNQRVEDFDPGKINILPLLHRSIASLFFEAHKDFTGKEGGNYFNYTAEKIASLLLEHKDKLAIWIYGISSRVVFNKKRRTREWNL